MMKKIIKIVLTAAFLVGLAGCDMQDKQSKEDCLDSFFSKAQNGSFSSMYKEIHPDNNDRSSYKSGTTFGTLYDTSVTYSISSKSGDVYYVDVNGDPDHGAITKTEKFTFQVEEATLFGDDTWLIRKFTSGGQTATW